MKKKLIIFMPSIEGGGVEKNLFIIANYLSNKLKNTLILTSTNEFNNKFKNTNIVNPNFNFKKNQGRRLRYLLCLFELIKLIFKYKKNIVVLAFQANLYCAIICKIFNVKIVIRSNSSPSGWSNNFIKKFLYKILFKVPNKVIVNSNDFKRELKQKFNINALCIFNPLNKKIIKIVFVGRFVDQKDPMTFLKALLIINKKINFKALMIGRGILKKDMLNFIKHNELNKKIKLLNFQNNPYKYIKKSDLFVLTSKFEGLPNVLLEAICLNKFVISTDCPTGPREILDNKKGGILFNIGDSKSLAENIIYFSKNKKKCKSKLNFAKRRLYRFDYNTNLNKYLIVIKKYLI